MAVDYFHRLLVSGKPADVRAFRDAIYREYPRTIAGKTWTEIVPFSFAGLYELAVNVKEVVHLYAASWKRIHGERRPKLAWGRRWL